MFLNEYCHDIFIYYHDLQRRFDIIDFFVHETISRLQNTIEFPNWIFYILSSRTFSDALITVIVSWTRSTLRIDFFCRFAFAQDCWSLWKQKARHIPRLSCIFYTSRKPVATLHLHDVQRWTNSFTVINTLTILITTNYFEN